MYNKYGGEYYLKWLLNYTNNEKKDVLIQTKGVTKKIKSRVIVEIW